MVDIPLARGGIAAVVLLRKGAKDRAANAPLQIRDPPFFGRRTRGARILRFNMNVAVRLPHGQTDAALLRSHAGLDGVVQQVSQRNDQICVGNAGHGRKGHVKRRRDLFPFQLLQPVPQEGMHHGIFAGAQNALRRGALLQPRRVLHGLVQPPVQQKRANGKYMICNIVPQRRHIGVVGGKRFVVFPLRLDLPAEQVILRLQAGIVRQPPDLAEPDEVRDEANHGTAQDKQRGVRRDVLRDGKDIAGQQDELRDRKEQEEPVLPCRKLIHILRGLFAKQQVDKKQEDRLAAEIRQIPPDIQHGIIPVMRINRDGREQQIGNELRRNDRGINAEHDEQLPEEPVLKENQRKGKEYRHDRKGANGVQQWQQLREAADQCAEGKPARLQQNGRPAGKPRLQAVICGVPHHSQAEQVMYREYEIAEHFKTSYFMLFFQYKL